MYAIARHTKQLPTFLGCWVLIGICAASMSTSDGAILAISTVLSHNIARKVDQGQHTQAIELRLLVVSTVPSFKEYRP